MLPLSSWCFFYPFSASNQDLDVLEAPDWWHRHADEPGAEHVPGNKWLLKQNNWDFQGRCMEICGNVWKWGLTKNSDLLQSIMMRLIATVLAVPPLVRFCMQPWLKTMFESNKHQMNTRFYQHMWFHGIWKRWFWAFGKMRLSRFRTNSLTEMPKSSGS